VIVAALRRTCALDFTYLQVKTYELMQSCETTAYARSPDLF